MALKIEWIRKGTVEGSNLSAHRVLKKRLF